MKFKFLIFALLSVFVLAGVKAQDSSGYADPSESTDSTLSLTSSWLYDYDGDTSWGFTIQGPVKDGQLKEYTIQYEVSMEVDWYRHFEVFGVGYDSERLDSFPFDTRFFELVGDFRWGENFNQDWPYQALHAVGDECSRYRYRLVLSITGRRDDSFTDLLFPIIDQTIITPWSDWIMGPATGGSDFSGY